MTRRGWLLVAAIGAAILVPVVLGGSELLERLRHFPLDLLVLMLAMVMLGWCLNAYRLRLLIGRGLLNQRRAVAIVVATTGVWLMSAVDPRYLSAPFTRTSTSRS